MDVLDEVDDDDGDVCNDDSTMILIATVAISNCHDGNGAVTVQTSTSLNLI